MPRKSNPSSSLVKEKYRQKPIEKRIANLYAPLWEAYDKKLFDESVDFFGQRLTANGINLSWFRGKTCLDAGCGGGRYVAALAQLKVKKVIGIDMNFLGLRDAQKRISERKLKNAQLEHGSVLDIPYPDDTFDFVCCNGVLHHTVNPDTGLNELVRVLRPKGILFLYVYGKGGLMWTFIDFLRLLGNVVPMSITKKIMTRLGMPTNNQFHWLDLMYVPIQKRYQAKAVLRWLESKGLKNIRLLGKERYPVPGIKGKLIYGEGELRFLATK